jgi:hypothetical protein
MADEVRIGTAQARAATTYGRVAGPASKPERETALHQSRAGACGRGSAAIGRSNREVIGAAIWTRIGAANDLR